MRISKRASVTSLLTALSLLALGGCSTAPVQTGPVADEPVFSADRVLGEGVIYAGDAIADPWQGFNRRMYRFNYGFDKYLFLPVVRGYQAVTPDIAEQGIHNFFNNLRDVRTLINSLLQGNSGKFVETTNRLFFNTTIGLLGFIDVATAFDIPKHDEDFGQTLGYWGVGRGPYLVLPILGPSSVRDGVGLGVDWFATTTVRNAAVDLRTWEEWTLAILNGIDTRAHVPFRYYETGSPFEYDMVRWVYTTKRELDIAK